MDGIDIEQGGGFGLNLSTVPEGSETTNNNDVSMTENIALDDDNDDNNNNDHHPQQLLGQPSSSWSQNDDNDDRMNLRGPADLVSSSEGLPTFSSHDNNDDDDDDDEYSVLMTSEDEDDADDDDNNDDKQQRSVNFRSGGNNNSEDRRMGGSAARRTSSNRGMSRMIGRNNLKDTSYQRDSTRLNVKIRKTESCDAMDEKTRRRQRWKKQLSLRKWIGTGSDDDDSIGDSSGAKISMHGRLMVQPMHSNNNVTKNRNNNNNNNNTTSIMNGISIHSAISEETDFNLAEEEKKRAETQYRLTTIKKKTNVKLDIKGMYEDLTTGEVTECCLCRLCPCPNVNSDRAMSSFLHWSFRSPFVVVFGTATIGWLGMTFVFAVLLFLLGLYEPYCIGGVDFASTRAKFTDAYQLSWTTFSTVGYGLIYPATSANHPNIHQCTLITVLTTFESFVGVLFSSLCAALMFAKVARVQSFAQVTFSDPIVIRYGTGVTTPEGHDEDDDDDASDGLSLANKVDTKDPLGLRIPCPVLEFRIFNRLDTIQGGEIIDATLNMVAVIDVSQADPALLAQTRRKKRGKKKRGPTRTKTPAALRYQRQPTLTREEGRKLSEETAKTYRPERTPSPVTPPPASPAQESTVIEDIPKPNTVTAELRHRSVADRDDPLPHRGPAPSLTPSSKSLHREGSDKRSVVKVSSPEPEDDPRYHKGHIDPRVAARRNRAQHPSMAASRGPGGSLASSMFNRLRFPSSGHRRRHETGSIFFQPGLNHVSMRNAKNQQFEEDPSGKIIPKKMLSKLEVESPDHPFFRRIWLVRHTLDVNSLLLKPHVRDMVRRNAGFWPKELNNYESIRASLEFDQILISISGTSNADANSVYAQHVYHLWDVNIGYRFVNALYRDPKDGALKVDPSLINDVMEQAGGGGEPLDVDLNDSTHLQDIMVL